MIKIHISDIGTDGIRRVSEAMVKHLPAFGVETTPHLSEADIIVNHAAATVWKRGTPMVAVNHGLYWSRQPWGESYQEVNEMVVDAMCRAVAITAPSEWVARAIRRGGFFYPEVVYHGVDYRDFQPGMNGGYVLWNKARADEVSNPEDVMSTARLLPGVPFWTTFGTRTENVKVIGKMDHARMREIVADASVYLGTVRETFGIGTLEAMACGVPVAGFAWGGTQEIVLQGETGYLAPPGDFKALAECIHRCLAERDRLSANCLADVRERWQWEPRIQQYANLFKRVYRVYETERPLVSVILTAYKLDRFLPKAIESVQRQTLTDWELIVVDDAPLDSTRIIVEDYARADPRIQYKPVPENFGLPGARNYGFSFARGRYIRHLDADDFLADNALALEAEALDSDPGIHIAYGHIGVVNEDGSQILTRSGEVERCGWPPPQFTWEEQMAHLNQLPSCVMARREVFERTGGYRRRMKRNEDAEFWCRATSGGLRAKKFTQAVTYLHRQRNDSKGAVEWAKEGKEPDWTAWFPWRMGASEYSDAIRVLRKYGGKHPKPHLVPFGAQGRPAREKFWYVHDYAYPVVSVIVTVGPHHKEFLVDALDSVLAQSYPDWECIVVNDTGIPWDKDIPGAPWAQVVNMDGNQGTSAARNAGYRRARGSLIAFLDADDYWMPWFLDLMVAHAEENPGGIIYSDLIEDNDGTRRVHHYPEFDSRKVPNTMQYPGSSILIPRKVMDAVIALQGGYDTQTPGMEDWDFQVACHHLGFCAYAVPEPLFVYRLHTSTKRETDYAKIDDIRAYMDRKWREYRLGEVTMACGCSSGKKTNNRPKTTLQSSGAFASNEGVNSGELEAATTMVKVEYMGDNPGTFSVKSRVQAGIVYRFGNNPGHKVKDVFLGDAEVLEGLTDAAGRPQYVRLNNVPMEGVRDPAAFLGAPIGA